jgi:hypothetical protein
LETTGSLLAKIIDSEVAIYQGRIWLTADGFEREGRISYSDGLDSAMSAFGTAQNVASSDLRLLILAEYTYLAQEQKHCAPSDIQTIMSLKQAIQSFDDALLSLQAVEKGYLYQIADMTYPHNAKHRIKDMARDAFHEACFSHRTRIDNILRAPGINLMEKELLKLRKANLAVAQEVYLNKQRATLSQTADQ